MEQKSKSEAIKEISEAIDKREKYEDQFLLKGTMETVKICIEVTDTECFIDKKGQKWVRA